MVTAKNRNRLRRHESQAEGYLELGMAEHALHALDRLGELAGSSSHALYLRGEALLTLQRYQEALEPFQRAAIFDPANTHLWLALGWCHKRTGRIDLAVAALERAVRIDPSDALIQYNLACYLSLAGNRRGALEHLAAAVELDSDYRMMTHEESDFDPLRSDPHFQALTSVIV